MAPAILLVILGLVLGGCASLNLFNNTFLNTFQPFGVTSLNNVEAKGPLTVVVENLTVEARHQEFAQIVISYVDETGNIRSVQSSPLRAVPLNQRDPTKANFDPSYREILVLDCGVQSMAFSGVVSRTAIRVVQTPVVPLVSTTTDNNTSTTVVTDTVNIDVASPAVLRDNSTTPARLTTQTFEQFVATQVPAAPLIQTLHYQCGDVVVVGLLDQQTTNNQIALQLYPSTFDNANGLSANFDNATRDTALFPYGFPWLYDPTNSYLTAEYQYPVGYVLIPLVLPNIQGIDQVLPVMQQIAAQNAKTN